MYWEAVKQRLARNRKALDLVGRAAAMEKCWFPVDYQVGMSLHLPHLARLRAAARLLRLRARFRRHLGDFAGAYDDLRITLRLESATRQPILICCLVGNLLVDLALDGLKETLSQDPAHPAEWRRFLAELETLDRRGLFADALQGERILVRTTLHNAGPQVVANLVGSSSSARPSALWTLLCWIGRPILRQGEALYLRHITELVEAVGKGLPQSLREIERVESSLEKQPHRRLAVVRLLAATVGRAYKSYIEAEALQRLAHLALVLKLYKHEHGSYPETLAPLVPGILGAIPVDPFTGKPFVYRRQGEGFILYSVGADFTDNGGKEAPPDPHDRYQGVDVVWRFKQ